MNPEISQVLQNAVDQLTADVQTHQANVDQARALIAGANQDNDAAQAAAAASVQAAAQHLADVEAAQAAVIDAETATAVTEQRVVDQLAALLAQG